MTVELAWAVQEELETLLDDSGHLRTLAFLYASKGMSSKALGIWRILARHYSSGLWKDPVLESGSQDGGTNIVSGKETAAAEASKLLEESSDPELVLQHLGWVCVNYLQCCFYFILDGLSCFSFTILTILEKAEGVVFRKSNV